MIPTLQANTVRLKIDPPVPEGFEHRGIIEDSSRLFAGCHYFVKGNRWETDIRTCPHPPGSKLEVREECGICLGTGLHAKIEPSAESVGCRDGEITRTVTVRSNSVDGDCWVLEVEP